MEDIINQIYIESDTHIIFEPKDEYKQTDNMIGIINKQNNTIILIESQIGIDLMELT